jgi:glycine hydroxymethyltransferase
MEQSIVASYLEQNSNQSINSSFIAFLAGLETIAGTAPEVARSIVQELADQRSNLKLIASENYSSLASQLAMGNLLTDKYAEGYAYHRFYAGCDNVDTVENMAVEEAKKLFGCEHAYVQPHSGADANLVAYWAILSTRVEAPFLNSLKVKGAGDLNDSDWAALRRDMGNQRLLGLDYYSGGHLTHGYKMNVSSRMFDAHSYTVSRETGLIDYDMIESRARELKPLILLAGYSAYPRAINFKKMRDIADRVGAVLMVDMAHFAGLVAGGVFTGEMNPVPYADVVTTTTHKTLRGPRGGMVLCTGEFADAVNRGCPLVIGGPLPHVMASKAVAFREANRPEFKTYAADIVKNARALARFCMEAGMDVATGGTDNHLLLVDVRNFGLTGRQAESALRECGVTLNRNSLPFDMNGPWYTSGIRVGTPAVTTLGMDVSEMKEIAGIMHGVLSNTAAQTDPQTHKKSLAKFDTSANAINEARTRVDDLLSRFPVYPELDLEFLLDSFVNNDMSVAV